MTLEDAQLVAEMLVDTGRAVPADQWVDELVADARSATLAEYGLA